MREVFTRTGPFRDAIEGRAPMPEAAATRGFEFINADPERQTIELAFSGVLRGAAPAGGVLQEPSMTKRGGADFYEVCAVEAMLPHPNVQLAPAQAERAGGARLVVARLLQGLVDHRALHRVQAGG
jgi:hypothetical protein